jgi:hypothetical protein
MNKLRTFILNNKGLVFFASALFLRVVLDLFPGIFERAYFHGFFPALRSLQSKIDFLWLLPGYSLLIIFVGAAFIWKFIKKKSFRAFLSWSLNFLAFLIGVFLICFGYQYLDKGLAQRMSLPESGKTYDLVSLYNEAMDSCVAARARIPNISEVASIVDYNDLPSNDEIQRHLESSLSPAGYEAVEIPIQVREIKPEGSLRALGISGIYNPFTGEANVESALPSIRKLFVVAHEMAHASGITSEAEANFAAYLACTNSESAILQYSGYYAIWRQIAQEINKNYSEAERELIASTIPEVLITDRRAIIEAYYKHKAYFPELSSKINDSYLKIQGVETGIEDYDRFLQLYLAYRDLVEDNRKRN